MDSGMMHRLGGLLCLAVAAGVGWWGIWQPWQAALHHAPQVGYNTKVFVLVPFASVFGLFFLIFGNSVAYRIPEKQNFTPAGWLLMALALVAGGAGFWWFQAQFGALGYSPG